MFSSKSNNKVLRALSLKALAFIGCHVLSIVIKHKEYDNKYKDDINELKDTSRILRKFILDKSKLDLKDNYNASEIWLGIDLVSPIFDEYCIICKKEKALFKKKRGFI